MRAVDTNVLVRLIARDDARQAAAAEVFISHGAWVSHLVLVETTWVLDSVYLRSHQQILVGVQMLLKHRHLTLQDADVVSAALRHYQARPKLGFADCMMLEIARKAGHSPLGTFDRQLGRLDGALVL